MKWIKISKQWPDHTFCSFRRALTLESKPIDQWLPHTHRITTEQLEEEIGLHQISLITQRILSRSYFNHRFLAPSGAPTDVHAHPIGSKQIEITWKPPPSESWQGVLKGYYLGYKVTSSPLAYVYHTTTDPNGRRFRIKGLQKSTPYSIVVKAYNGMGSGPESQPIEVKTRESDPPYPPSFVISDVTSNSALVQMKSEEMSPVLQYIVEYRRQGEEWNPVHVPRDKSSFQLSRLDNCMTYEVRLAAYNEHGRGEFSSTLAFTTTERETNIGFRSSEEDIPFYFRHYFVLPVAASVVVIVTTVVFAWVCYKRVVFRQHRHLVLQQQLAGHLPEGQLTLHRDGYIRPPRTAPFQSTRGGRFHLHCGHPQP
ncbi:hypothetical protein CEXT_668791 [Caerostris extrusa]|uniref:Fibronectin type-III domain-containing protein n=1 Tax=Caerostris extrusa TaxID=172846 RepID=A0AAV4XC64_CAEEX|nr:hypothetical protein CEXT_668791 [Caerostris extrusa]